MHSKNKCHTFAVYYLTNTLKMIQIQNFSFSYSRKKQIYSNLSLALPSGSIYGLLGKNGAGKSTLLKTMVGLLFPTEGVVRVNNFEPKRRQPSFLQTIYFIPEQTYVPSLTVERYVNLYAPFYPKFDKKLLAEYLKVLDVNAEGKLTALSFGQQKKFIIAFGLACNTAVLVMDEPTNGLDIPSKSQFRKLIASALTDDKTIVISTHQVRDLDNLIDQIVIVDDGKLLLNASISDISDKLCLKTVAQLSETHKTIYAESSFGGHAVVTQNTEGVDTKVNLELLFNAVTTNQEAIDQIFNNQNTNHKNPSISLNQ